MNELATQPPAVRSFCSFRLSGRLFGIEIGQVREVCRMLPVTPVPQAPGVVTGLVNLRSRIYLVLDPRPMLGFPATGSADEGSLMILKPDVGKDLAVFVEEGGDIVHVAAGQIEPSGISGNPPAAPESPLVTAVCKLDGELMMVIDPQALQKNWESLA